MPELNERINSYIKEVCSFVKNKIAHKSITLELQDHISDLIDEYMDSGVSEEESIEKALKEMGDTKTIGMELNKIHRTSPDWILLGTTCALILLGFIAITTVNIDISLKSHIISIIIIIPIALFFYKFDFKRIKNYSYVIYSLGLTLLCGNTILGIGANGATGFITFNNISIDSITICLFLFTISFAGIFSDIEGKSKKVMALHIALTIPPLIVLTKIHLTSALIIYLSIVFFMMLLSNLKLRYIIIYFAPIISLGYLYIVNSPLGKARLEIFLHYEKYASSGGLIYNSITSLKNSVSIFSPQDTSLLNILTETHTDFIFISTLYRLGWIFGITMLIFILGFIIRIILLGAKVKISYGKLLILGIGSMLGTQFIIYILSNLNIIPFLSVSLPFISYGGTNLFISIVSVLIINNVYKNRSYC